MHTNLILEDKDKLNYDMGKPYWQFIAKAIFPSGNIIETCIRGNSWKAIENYYTKNTFNTAPYPNELMESAERVEFKGYW